MIPFLIDRATGVKLFLNLGVNVFFQLIFIGILLSRPGLEHRMDQSGQGNGQKKPPSAPQTAEYQHRHNDGHRMQAHHPGQEKRHQQIAVQGLDNAIGRHEPGGFGNHSPLEKPHQGNGQKNHGCANVGNQHGKSHQQGKQQGELQSKGGKGDIADAPDDKNLPDFSPDIVGNLQIHLVPHLVGKVPVGGQKTFQPVQNQLLILQKKEDQQGHQHQVDNDNDHIFHRCQGKAQKLLALVVKFRCYGGHQIIDLGPADEIRVFFQKGLQSLLPFAQHGRQLLDKLDDLSGKQGKQSHKGDHDTGDKKGKHDDNSAFSGNFKTLKPLNNAFQKVGQNNTHENGNQHAA